MNAGVLPVFMTKCKAVRGCFPVALPNLLFAVPIWAVLERRASPVRNVAEGPESLSEVPVAAGESYNTAG